MKTIKNEELRKFLEEAENSYYADALYGEGDFEEAEGRDTRDPLYGEGYSGAGGNEYGADGDDDAFGAEYLQAITSPMQYLTSRQPALLGMTPRDQVAYQFRITNNTITSQTVGLFSSYFQAPIPAGVTVELLNPVSGLTTIDGYTWFVNQLAVNPLVTLLVRLESNNVANLSGNFSYTILEAGVTRNEIVQIYRSPNQFQSDIVEIPRTISLSGYTRVDFNVVANSILTISIFASSRVYVTNMAFGQSPAVSPLAAPTTKRPVRALRPARF